MSGGGFSSTARGVNDDSPIDRVQDPHPSIMMVVRGTGGQCRVGGMKLAVARVADHETGKRHLVAVPVWRVAGTFLPGAYITRLGASCIAT